MLPSSSQRHEYRCDQIYERPTHSYTHCCAASRSFHDLGATVLLTDLDNDAVTSAAAGLDGGSPGQHRCAGHRGRRGGRGDVPTHRRGVGRIGNVISCAAVITANRALGITPDRWQRVLSIKVVGTFSVCHQSIRGMAAQRFGCIVAVASDAVKRGGGGLVADAAYAASKAGVRRQCSSALLRASPALALAAFGPSVRGCETPLLRRPP